MPDLSGQKIGCYHIIEQLGEGGMATVYHAVDTRLERDVAFKIIRREVISNEASERMLKRFEREARALAKLSDLHIVKILDYGEHDGSPYLVMEYLPGGTLKTKMGTPLPSSEAARLLLPVARALAYAHRQGVIHRDVKPANILITANGEPLLADFGIARILDVEDGHTLTGTNVGPGTPEYMAPEQWQNRITPQTDIYALGVVFFELVTGRKPYIADTPAAILLKQAMEPLPQPSKFVSGLSEDVEIAISRAMAKKPDERYATMDEFAAALEKLADQPATRQPIKIKTPPHVEENAFITREESTYETPDPVNRQIPDQKKTTDERLNRKKLLGASGFLVGVIVLLLVIFAAQRMTTSPTVKPHINAFVPTTQSSEVYVKAPTEIPTLGATEISALEPLKAATSPSLQETTAPPKGEPGIGSTKESLIDGMTMMYVPAGEFQMGSNTVSDYEKPVHTVTLDAFWMDKTEVTYAMYSQCVKSKKCEPAFCYGRNVEQPQYPATCVDWNKAKQYCSWAGRDLPTEAQWEKAARGTEGRTFPWGEEEEKGKFSGSLVSVGSDPGNASPYGVLDMVGSAEEWTADWFGRDYYKNSPNSNPTGAAYGEYRVLRGGPGGAAVKIVAAKRNFHRFDSTDPEIGFRCVFNGDKSSATATQIPSIDPTNKTAEVPTGFPQTSMAEASALTPTEFVNTPSSAGGLGIGSTQISPIDGMTMMYIPAGEFQMGTNNASDSEKPAHTVYLDAYWIDQTEVTNAMYSKCIQAKKCSTPITTYGICIDLPNYPATCVDWNKAKSYCEWAGRILPTEAQWEKAARGADGQTYPWGDDGEKSPYNRGQIMPVGSYSDFASPYGVLDMVGSVNEWVSDWYGRDYYKKSPANNPKGASFGEYHIIRGGFAWGNLSTTTTRIFNRFDTTGPDIGIRCVLGIATTN